MLFFNQIYFSSFHNEYLKDNNCYVTEGYTEQVPEQVQILKALVNNDKIINVLEIGMNAGHSSCLFLENNNIFSNT